MAWSIVLATKGLKGFIDDLLNSEEYLSQFGDDTVPYQRRRILPQRVQGELPFARMPRYGADHRTQLEEMGYFQPMRPPYIPPAWTLLVGKAITLTGAGVLILATLAIALAAWGFITI